MIRNVKIYKLIIPMIIIVLGFVRCNEKIYVDEIPDQLIPVVNSFDPQVAEVGEIVNIRGENFNYAKKAYIGTREVTIKYKTNDSLLVVVINNDISGGPVKVVNEKAEGTESSESLSITYKEPVMDEVPASGKINEEVLIKGSNLQYVKQLLVGDVVVDIVAQSSAELVFKVPFLLADDAILSYDYVSAQGDQTVALSGSFGVIKSWPAFTSVPDKAMINTEVTIIGENMNVVDSVYFGSYKVEPTAQDPLTLSFTIPDDVELEGYQAVKLYSYGGQELSSGAVLRVITKLERMLESFEAFEGDPFTKKKDIFPVYETGLNGNTEISAKEGSFYAHMGIDYDQSQRNNSGSTFCEFYYKGDKQEDGNYLINLNDFDDPWVHMWINTNNTDPYFVFYCDLATSVDGVDKDRATHYVKRFNSADYGEGWQLFAWRLKDLKFRSGGSAEPYSSDLFSIYNLKTFRMQFRTSSDIPLEKSEFNFDSFMVVDGKMKGANDVTFLGNE